MIDPTCAATNTPLAAPAIASPKRSRMWANFLTLDRIVVAPRIADIRLGHPSAARKMFPAEGLARARANKGYLVPLDQRGARIARNEGFVRRNRGDEIVVVPRIFRAGGTDDKLRDEATQPVRLGRFPGIVAHAVLRGAAVSTSPVLGVPVGSISNKCTSSFATGRCSTPFGTMYICPGPSVTVRSRS